ILAAAIERNKNTQFIEYLLNNGANIHKRLDKHIMPTHMGDIISCSICLPIALASSNGNPDTVALLIKYGGLNKLSGSAKNGLLIRFIRELKKEKIKNYLICLNYLIKAECPLDCTTALLSKYAYRDLKGGSRSSQTLTSPLIEAIILN